MLTNTGAILDSGGSLSGTNAADKKEQEFTTAAQAAIAMAHSLEIKSDADLHTAAGLMKGFKDAKKSVQDFFKPLKDDAHKAHRTICDREKALLSPYADADRAIKTKVTAYNAEQKRLADIEASRIKRLQGEETEKLIEQAVKAESGGDSVSSEMLLRQAEITESIKAPAATQPQKVDGISYRDTYNITIEDLSKVPCEFGGVVIRPIDESAVRKLAQISRGNVSIPGIKITTKKVAYSR